MSSRGVERNSGSDDDSYGQGRGSSLKRMRGMAERTAGSNRPRDPNGDNQRESTQYGEGRGDTHSTPADAGGTKTSTSGRQSERALRLQNRHARSLLDAAGTDEDNDDRAAKTTKNEDYESKIPSSQGPLTQTPESEGAKGKQPGPTTPQTSDDELVEAKMSKQPHLGKTNSKNGVNKDHDEQGGEDDQRNEDVRTHQDLKITHAPVDPIPSYSHGKKDPAMLLIQRRMMPRNAYQDNDSDKESVSTDFTMTSGVTDLTNVSRDFDYESLPTGKSIYVSELERDGFKEAKLIIETMVNGGCHDMAKISSKLRNLEMWGRYSSFLKKQIKKRVHREVLRGIEDDKSRDKEKITRLEEEVEKLQRRLEGEEEYSAYNKKRLDQQLEKHAEEMRKRSLDEERRFEHMVNSLQGAKAQEGAVHGPTTTSSVKIETEATNEKGMPKLTPQRSTTIGGRKSSISGTSTTPSTKGVIMTLPNSSVVQELLLKEEQPRVALRPYSTGVNDYTKEDVLKALAVAEAKAGTMHYKTKGTINDKISKLHILQQERFDVGDVYKEKLSRRLNKQVTQLLDSMQVDWPGLEHVLVLAGIYPTSTEDPTITLERACEWVLEHSVDGPDDEIQHAVFIIIKWHRRIVTEEKYQMDKAGLSRMGASPTIHTLLYVLAMGAYTTLDRSLITDATGVSYDQIIKAEALRKLLVSNMYEGRKTPEEITRWVRARVRDFSRTHGVPLDQTRMVETVHQGLHSGPLKEYAMSTMTELVRFGKGDVTLDVYLLHLERVWEKHNESKLPSLTLDDEEDDGSSANTQPKDTDATKKAKKNAQLKSMQTHPDPRHHTRSQRGPSYDRTRRNFDKEDTASNPFRRDRGVSPTPSSRSNTSNSSTSSQSRYLYECEVHPNCFQKTCEKKQEWPQNSWRTMMYYKYQFRLKEKGEPHDPIPPHLLKQYEAVKRVRVDFEIPNKKLDKSSDGQQSKTDQGASTSTHAASKSSITKSRRMKVSRHYEFDSQLGYPGEGPMTDDGARDNVQGYGSPTSGNTQLVETQGGVNSWKFPLSVKAEQTMREKEEVIKKQLMARSGITKKEAVRFHHRVVTEKLIHESAKRVARKVGSLSMDLQTQQKAEIKLLGLRLNDGTKVEKRLVERTMYEFNRTRVYERRLTCKEVMVKETYKGYETDTFITNDTSSLELTEIERVGPSTHSIEENVPKSQGKFEHDQTLGYKGEGPPLLRTTKVTKRGSEVNNDQDEATASNLTDAVTREQGGETLIVEDNAGGDTRATKRNAVDGEGTVNSTANERTDESLATVRAADGEGAQSSAAKMMKTAGNGEGKRAPAQKGVKKRVLSSDEYKRMKNLVKAAEGLMKERQDEKTRALTEEILGLMEDMHSMNTDRCARMEEENAQGIAQEEVPLRKIQGGYNDDFIVWYNSKGSEEIIVTNYSYDSDDSEGDPREGKILREHDRANQQYYLPRDAGLFEQVPLIQQEIGGKGKTKFVFKGVEYETGYRGVPVCQTTMVPLAYEGELKNISSTECLIREGCVKGDIPKAMISNVENRGHYPYTATDRKWAVNQMVRKTIATQRFVDSKRIQQAEYDSYLDGKYQELAVFNQRNDTLYKEDMNSRPIHELYCDRNNTDSIGSREEGIHKPTGPKAIKYELFGQREEKLKEINLGWEKRFDVWKEMFLTPSEQNLCLDDVINDWEHFCKHVDSINMENSLHKIMVQRLFEEVEKDSENNEWCMCSGAESTIESIAKKLPTMNALLNVELPISTEGNIVFKSKLLGILDKDWKPCNLKRAYEVKDFLRAGRGGAKVTSDLRDGKINVACYAEVTTTDNEENDGVRYTTHYDAYRTKTATIPLLGPESVLDDQLRRWVARFRMYGDKYTLTDSWNDARWELTQQWEYRLLRIVLSFLKGDVGEICLLEHTCAMISRYRTWINIHLRKSNVAPNVATGLLCNNLRVLFIAEPSYARTMLKALTTSDELLNDCFPGMTYATRWAFEVRRKVIDALFVDFFKVDCDCPAPLVYIGPVYVKGETIEYTGVRRIVQIMEEQLMDCFEGNMTEKEKMKVRKEIIMRSYETAVRFREYEQRTVPNDINKRIFTSSAGYEWEDIARSIFDDAYGLWASRNRATLGSNSPTSKGAVMMGDAIIKLLIKMEGGDVVTAMKHPSTTMLNLGRTETLGTILSLTVEDARDYIHGVAKCNYGTCGALMCKGMHPASILSIFGRKRCEGCKIKTVGNENQETVEAKNESYYEAVNMKGEAIISAPKNALSMEQLLGMPDVEVEQGGNGTIGSEPHGKAKPIKPIILEWNRYCAPGCYISYTDRNGKERYLCNLCNDRLLNRELAYCKVCCEFEETTPPRDKLETWAEFRDMKKLLKKFANYEDNPYICKVCKYKYEKPDDMRAAQKMYRDQHMKVMGGNGYQRLIQLGQEWDNPHIHEIRECITMKLAEWALEERQSKGNLTKKHISNFSSVEVVAKGKKVDSKAYKSDKKEEDKDISAGDRDVSKHPENSSDELSQLNLDDGSLMNPINSYYDLICNPYKPLSWTNPIGFTNQWKDGTCLAHKLKQQSQPIPKQNPTQPKRKKTRKPTNKLCTQPVMYDEHAKPSNQPIYVKSFKHANVDHYTVYYEGEVYLEHCVDEDVVRDVVDHLKKAQVHHKNNAWEEVRNHKKSRRDSAKRSDGQPTNTQSLKEDPIHLSTREESWDVADSADNHGISTALMENTNQSTQPQCGTKTNCKKHRAKALMLKAMKVLLEDTLDSQRESDTDSDNTSSSGFETQTEWIKLRRLHDDSDEESAIRQHMHDTAIQVRRPRPDIATIMRTEKTVNHKTVSMKRSIKEKEGLKEPPPGYRYVTFAVDSGADHHSNSEHQQGTPYSDTLYTVTGVNPTHPMHARSQEEQSFMVEYLTMGDTKKKKGYATMRLNDVLVHKKFEDNLFSVTRAVKDQGLTVIFSPDLGAFAIHGSIDLKINPKMPGGTFFKIPFTEQNSGWNLETLVKTEGHGSYAVDEHTP